MAYRFMRFCWFFLMFFSGCSLMSEDVILLNNGGFEKGLDSWTIPKDEGMTTLSDAKAAEGKYSLRIVDMDGKRGSSAASEMVPVTSPGVIELRGKVFSISGGGLGVYLRTFDADKQEISEGTENVVGLGGTDKEWRPFLLRAIIPDKARYAQVWIHSFSSARVEGYLDDLKLVNCGLGATSPPWQGIYKIHPDDKARLTAADVVGPDGIVYPDWRYAGIPGGIPKVEVRTTIEEHGGKANDDQDDSAALQAACDAVGKQGGGAVSLDAGLYYLDHPVVVRYDGVVIRGKGMEQTKIIFRYDLPENGIAFYDLKDGAKIGENSLIVLHCFPKGLMEMKILADNKVLKQWKRSQHSGNTYATDVSGRELLKKAGAGNHQLKGLGIYSDGARRERTLSVVADARYTDPAPATNIESVITFQGDGYLSGKIPLTKDGNRGDLELTLSNTKGLAAGDYVLLDGPATARWKVITQNQCPWGSYRQCIYRIEAVNGNTVRINQPLRIQFPVIDGSNVRKIGMRKNCGLEDLTIEQIADLWITTSGFKFGVQCWARGVKVKKCGRFPIYGNFAKQCEIRDCVFDDAWFKGGGGTAYGGWEKSWDCLIDNLETFKLRHAPLFQWAASGNVIRNAVCHESDGQWHSGWTNENLMEQCVIESSLGNGSYGHGLWGSPPEDNAHGPNGPRNVVYNCDITCRKTGLWMGGMNENWLILYNRFDAEQGDGVFAKDASFDHIIRGNTFMLRNPDAGVLRLLSADCIGVEFCDNIVYGGNGRICTGLGKPEKAEGNKFLPLPEEKPPRPKPAVPSIFLWQREHE